MLQTEVHSDPVWDSATDWQTLSEAAVAAAVRSSSHAGLADGDFMVEISIKLGTNDEVQQLNAAYRNKDKPTNVLSFPMVPADLLSSLSNSDDGEVLLGDIVMAHQVCREEAAEKDISMADHASHLLVHGTLHLLGYDHETESDAILMEQIETTALQAVGIANPYTT